ncbi:MAG: hypothetical protein ABIH72_05410 [archaeon]
MKDGWTERVRKEALRNRDSLERTFEDGTKKYTFSFADIDAHSYGPCMPDYNLVADIKIADEATCKIERLWNQALGSGVKPQARESVPFGQEYFDGVKPILSKIVERELRRNNEELVEAIERIRRI